MDYQSVNEETTYPHIILDFRRGEKFEVRELVAFYQRIRSCVANPYFMDILRLYAAEFLRNNPSLTQITVTLISEKSNRITLVMHSENFYIHTVMAGDITYPFNKKKATNPKNPYDNQYLPYAAIEGIVHRLALYYGIRA
ncbi:hypothetical protein ACFE04_011007 [Oxalis oulophora]